MHSRDWVAPAIMGSKGGICTDIQQQARACLTAGQGSAVQGRDAIRCVPICSAATARALLCESVSHDWCWEVASCS